MTIGEKILKLRKARGWSQEELAERIGVTRQAVSRWESDSAKPDADKIIAVCDLFGISADYLLRDLGGSSDDTLHPSQPARKKEILWPAWIMIAFGVVSLFVLRILASVNRVYMSPTFTVSEDGLESLYDPGGYTDFWWYIEQNDFSWLFWLAVCVLTAGACLLLWHRINQRKKKTV